MRKRIRTLDNQKNVCHELLVWLLVVIKGVDAATICLLHKVRRQLRSKPYCYSKLFAIRCWLLSVKGRTLFAEVFENAKN
jgi:hypothetical protein